MLDGENIRGVIEYRESPWEAVAQPVEVARAVTHLSVQGRRSTLIARRSSIAR